MPETPSIFHQIHMINLISTDQSLSVIDLSGQDRSMPRAQLDKNPLRPAISPCAHLRISPGTPTGRMPGLPWLIIGGYVKVCYSMLQYVIVSRCF